MVMRKIIEIDRKKCTGCGLCIPDCPEGALQIIDGKAHLISDIFCDGLGACTGTCPEDAIRTVEREGEAYSERRTMENILEGGPNVIKAHLEHLRDHGQSAYYETAVEVLEEKGIPVPELGEVKPGAHHPRATDEVQSGGGGKMIRTELRQWPVQIHLLHTKAPFFDGSDLLLIADCAAVADPNLHKRLIRGKTVAMGCPKLDDANLYVEKLTEILRLNDIRSITVAVMEVPCCRGMARIAEEALRRSGKDIPLAKETISLTGEPKTC